MSNQQPPWVVESPAPFNTSINFNNPPASALAGSTPFQPGVTIYYGYSPQPAGSIPVTYSSSNPAVASVDSTGTITPIKPGTATITATVAVGAPDASVAYLLTVTGAASVPTTVTVSPNPGSVQAGHTLALTATTFDQFGQTMAGRTYSWSSGATGTATVNASTGVVTGVAAGTVTITATDSSASGGDVITVSAGGPVPTTVNVSPSSGIVGQGLTLQLSATTLDQNGNVMSGRTYSWGSSNTGIATVNSSGLVTGVTFGGPITITATDTGINGTSSVTVSTPTPTTVTIAPASFSLPATLTKQLTATTLDQFNNVMTGRTYSWSSSNTGLATVSGSGLVTGVSSGNVTITATDSVSGTSAGTITAAPVATTVTVSPTTPSVSAGATINLAATTKDQYGNLLTGRTYTWSTANGSIATVNSSGQTTGVVAGTVNITATDTGSPNPANHAVVTVTAASPAQEFGFHVDSMRNGTTTTMLTNLHGKINRSPMPWYDVEGTQGTFTWTSADTMVNNAVAGGVDMIVNLCFPPTWANNPGSNANVNHGFRPPYSTTPGSAWKNFTAAYATYAVACVNRYGTPGTGKVKIWEVENEQNQHFFWQQPNYPNVTAYCDLFSTVYAAMKAADPNAIVLIGGIVGLNAGPTTDYTGITFLADMYAAGVYGDGVCLHPYINGAPTTSPIQFQNSFADINTVHQNMVTAGHGNDKVMLTEWGYTGGTDSAISGYLTTGGNILTTNYTFVSKAAWFLLQETTSYPQSGGYSQSGTQTAVGSSFVTFAKGAGQ